MSLTDPERGQVTTARSKVAAIDVTNADNVANRQAALDLLDGALGSGTPPPPPAGNVLREDPCTDPVPDNLWGNLSGDRVDSSRIVTKSTGGPNNGPWRELTVKDGDSMGYSGERCEMGNNSRSYGLASPSNRSGTFFLGKSGDHRIIETWLKLGSNWPLSSDTWQVVTQLKQTQPYSSASSSTPQLSLEARGGKWKLFQRGSTVLWSFPANIGVWTKFTWDVVFSKSSSSGKLRLKVEPQGLSAGDSGTLTVATMAYDGSGNPIDAHLRIGAYHNASLSGTSIGVGPVTVSAP